ncbi:Uncharacterized protein TCM_045188 [Theobroma cacao]|uniref:RNase H type-1 domain-containing protein n=1 Tax=Theobroma cacao TaxID=3641 RepID=A0A061FSF6_THECC|nr:Uncharacterized protein TCM_045188 [Theobroma cacao]
MFSKASQRVDANMAEILANREAIKIFLALRWVRSHTLMVESNSSNVVSWIRNPKRAQWKHKRDLMILEGIKRRIGECSVRKINREANDIVDELAKSGMREEELLFICD